MVIKISFDDSAEISQGDLPDQLLLQFQLQEFSVDGKLPVNVLKQVDIPPQIESEAVANTIESLGENISTVLGASTAATIGSSIVLGLTLSHLWSLLNS